MKTIFSFNFPKQIHLVFLFHYITELIRKERLNIENKKEKCIKLMSCPKNVDFLVFFLCVSGLGRKYDLQMVLLLSKMNGPRSWSMLSLSGLWGMFNT